MIDGTYHRDIFLPPDLSLPIVGRWLLNYSQHALKAAQDDRYGVPLLPKEMTIEAAQIVEVEVFDGRPEKALVRVKHDDRRDLVLVLIFEITTRTIARVKTVWFNHVGDKHRTLDRSRYRHKPKLKK